MKKLIAALLSLATLGTVIAIPLQSKAFEINLGGYHFSDQNGYRSDFIYAVFYRKHQRDSWKLKDNYGSLYEAEYALHKLQDNGYIARIERRQR